MRVLVAAVTSCVLLSSADADSMNEKLCIFAAAKQLPQIPGLVITRSGTREMPPEHKKNPGITNLMVEIEVKAAAQDAVFSFVCGFAPGKPHIAIAVGLSR